MLTGCNAASTDKHTLDVLFIAYDQGESSAFLQIEDALTKKGIRFNVLALGRAAAVYKDRANVIILPEEVDPAALTHKRAGLLSSADLAAITQKCQPSVVYTGMASAVQAQLSNAFERRGSKVIAFYDNFDTAVGNAWIRPFLDTIKHIDELQVPTEQTLASFHHIDKLKDTRVTLVGQPALEEWDKVFRAVDARALREKLHISPSDSVVLFAGGNINDGYKQAFQRFVSAAAQLPRVQFLVTWHPKFDGTFEAEVVRLAHSGNIHRVDKAIASTAELCKLADVVTTYQSTVGAKALYKGKPVIYIAEKSYDNFLILAGLAERVSTVNATVKAIKDKLADKETKVSLSPLGMPDKPSSEVMRRIVEMLES
ncbi:hypothetical protein [Candidatus Sororendozoicomonas aggregata]|uniref:hypothetical protein n=1 Tax=Candidatus Sororendozoicomonas aggregata TaxID=3073239 RepID=UPI002ED1EFB1